MRIKTQVIALCLALLTLLTVLAGCGQNTRSMVLRVGLVGQSAVPDPAMVTTDSEKIVVSHLYENLMKLTPDGEGGTQVTGGQVRSYHCEDELDGTQTYTFTLRGDLTWSDGQPVTASDFVYAWQRLADPDTKSPNASLLSVVAGYDQVRSKGKGSLLQVKAEDEHTLVVKLNCHCPYFLTAICTAAATMPVRSDGAVATNGAYTVVSQENSHLRLTARSNYYDRKRLGPDELHFTFGKTTEELEALYDDGELDFMLGLPGEGTAEKVNPYPRMTALLINQSAPSMKSQSLRQAMSLVIDRNALTELADGVYLPAEGIVSHGIQFPDGTSFREHNGALIDNDSKHYKDNCAAAREKMAEAGYDSAAAMAALGKVTLLYAESERNERIVAFLQQTWQRELGLTVTLNGVEAEGLEKALKKGEFTLALTDVTASYNDATAFLSNWHSNAAGNYGRFRSSAYNMLLRVAAASSDDAAREAYLEDAERLLLEKGGVIPLYGAGCCYRLGEGLTGLIGNGVGVYYFFQIHEISHS